MVQKANWIAAGNAGKGGDAMVIFDYNNNDTSNAEITLVDSLVRSKTGYVSNVVFRNYPKLDFIDLCLVNCEFVNCKFISAYDGTVLKCTFDNFDSLFATRTEITDCTFRNLHCDHEGAVFLEDSTMALCSIQDSEFTNNAYFCEGLDDSHVGYCTIDNCSTERQDHQLFYGYRVVKKGFKKVAVEQDIVDSVTKDNLKQVKYIG